MNSFKQLVAHVKNANWSGANQVFSEIMQQKVADRLATERQTIFKEETDGDTKYQEYFKSQLKKHGYDSPADIPDDKKDDFFNAVDKGYKAKNENYGGKSGQILTETGVEDAQFKTYVRAEMKKQGLHEARTLNEDLSLSAFYEFFVYYNGTQVANTLINILVGLGVIASIEFVRMLGALPKTFQKFAQEARRAYDMWKTEKHLSSSEIERVTAAAKQVYPTLRPRTKSIVTSLSKKLEHADLESAEGKRLAASMVVDLIKIVKSHEDI
jgi:hypothetical protein